MNRNLQKNGVINLALVLFAGVAMYAAARYTHSLAGQVAVFFAGLGVLVAAVSAFQMRMEERERLERLDFDEVTRSAGSSTLFNTQEAEAFPARRSREQFEKFFVPSFTLLLVVLQTAGALWLWRWLNTASATPLTQPLVGIGLFGGFFLVLFLIGQYNARLANLEDDRLLRPSSNWVLLAAYVCVLVALGILGVFADFSKVDLILARVFCGLLLVFAVENVLSLLLEMYRPRIKGAVTRLLYDSRLIGLISHPESLFTTAAHALDYQFGFKVSETWFYQFLRRALAWLIVAQVGLLLLSTCLVFIESGEQGLLERFGRPVAGREVLGAGLHFKLPWPIDRVHRHRAEKIQTFSVGAETEDDGDAHEKTILWTVAHSKEEYNFLVANREGSAAQPGDTAAGKKRPPVSLLAGSVSFQYQVSDLRAWAYNFKDAAGLLKQIATREVVRYLVNADFGEVMSNGRVAAAQTLQERIQAQADALQLGAKLLFVGLQDIHPPVSVAGAFEQVVGAQQKQKAKRLIAEAYRIQADARARAESVTRVSEAEAQSKRRAVDAYARAALFTNQLPAFKASPTVYAQRAYLQAFGRASHSARKIVLATTNTHDVILLDLEEKIGSAEMFNLPLPTLKK